MPHPEFDYQEAREYGQIHNVVKEYGFIRGVKPEYNNVFFHISEFRDDETQVCLPILACKSVKSVPCGYDELSPVSPCGRRGRAAPQLKAGVDVEFSLCVERATGKTSAVDIFVAPPQEPAALAAALRGLSLAPAVAAVGLAGSETTAAGVPAMSGNKLRGIVERELPKGVSVRRRSTDVGMATRLGAHIDLAMR